MNEADAWRVAELLRHVCEDADRAGDVGLGLHASGLEFQALQFARSTGESLAFPGVLVAVGDELGASPTAVQRRDNAARRPPATKDRVKVVERGTEYER